MKLKVLLIDALFANSQGGHRYVKCANLPDDADSATLERHLPICVHTLFDVLHHHEGLESDYVGWALFVMVDDKPSESLTRLARGKLEAMRVGRIEEFERSGLSFTLGPKRVTNDGVQQGPHLRAGGK